MRYEAPRRGWTGALGRGALAARLAMPAAGTRPPPGRCRISPRAARPAPPAGRRRRPAPAPAPPLLDLAPGRPARGQAQVDAQLDTAAVTVPVDGSPLDPALIARERELLAYQPTRMTNEEIADRLGISVNTIKSHARALHRKLEVPIGGRSCGGPSKPA